MIGLGWLMGIFSRSRKTPNKRKQVLQSARDDLMELKMMVREQRTQEESSKIKTDILTRKVERLTVAGAIGGDYRKNL